MLNLLLGIHTAHAADATVAEKAVNTPFNTLEFIFSNAPFWLTAIMVFVGSLVIASLVKNTVESRLARKISDEQKEMQIMTGRVAFVIVAFIGISIALTIAGINMTTLIAAIGFGISFGLQDIVSNFVAGIYILASRPFTIGDWIEIDGRKGKVQMIGARATFLKTFDGLRLIVPNAQLFKSNVLSYTSNPMRRMKVPVYCRYLVSIKEVMDICLNVVRSDRRIFLEPKPNVVIIDFADYYMYLEVRFWVDSRGPWRRIQSKIFGDIQKRLEESGLDSPYPVTSLSLEQDAESVVLKTKTVSDEEIKVLMAQREAYEKDLAKRRSELMITPEVIQQNQQIAYDESGISFLKEISANQLPLNQQQALQNQPPVANTETEQSIPNNISSP